MHYVYIIHNIINNKIYVGYSANPIKRWKREQGAANQFKNLEYNSLLSKAIRKYGWNNFNKFILESYENQKEALEAEKFWIDFFRTNVKVYGSSYGYNQHEGGNIPPSHKGKTRSEWHKRRISETHRGKQISEKYKQHLRKINTGRKLTQEQKNIVSLTHKGRKRSKETCKRISDSKRGKKFSTEHKQKLSQKRLELIKNGLEPWNKGLTLNEHTKDKISTANKKLNSEQMAIIKKDQRPLLVIAKEYNVSVSTIRRIKKGYKYRV